MACKYYSKCTSWIKNSLDTCTKQSGDMYCSYFSKYAVQEYNKKHEVKSDDNPYWSNICKIADKQRKKGIETYGQGLEKNPMKIQERLTYLEEELVDALMYIEWCKDFLSKQNVENID